MSEVFKQYVQNRIHKRNKNFFMIVVGPTGSGKSYAALRLAEKLDPTFDISRCCFKAKEFLMKIREFQSTAEETGKEIKGQVIMWDELGVEHDSKRFMSTANRVVNYFFQTSRYLNLIMIMTVPYLSFIDSSSRKLSHCIAETTGINSREKQVSLKVKMMQVNPITSKEYPKYLRYRSNGRTKVMRKVKLDMPSKELIKEYEKKKRDYGSWLYQEGIEKLERQEDKNNRKQGLTEGSMQPLIWEMAIKHQYKWKTLEDLRKICSEVKGNEIKSSQFSENVKSMKKKGYNIRDFQGD